MKLTQRDKKILLAMKYTPEDFPQIERAAQVCKITTGAKDERITHRDFIKQLGRDWFILTLARAAFHFSASYIPEKNIFYIFDCYDLLEN